MPRVFLTQSAPHWAPRRRDDEETNDTDGRDGAHGVRLGGNGVRRAGDGSRASCAGYLASYANPNNGFVIHALEKPLAESLGVPMGTLQSGFAGQHNGSLEACIP